MKKTLSVILAALMLLSCASLVFAAEDSRGIVYVTIADKGTLAVADKPVVVKDIDADKAITVNDALYCAHEEYYKGGAKEGYSSYTGTYGLSLGKLWGDESDPDKNYYTNFGYYVNDGFAMSLADPVNAGDHVYAFSYTDTENWTDSYSFFDKKNVKAVSLEKTELTLNAYSFDENFMPVTAPLEGAEITVDGFRTFMVTDENGKADITILPPGEHVISATAPDGKIIAPPVCVINVEFDLVKMISNIFDGISEFFSGLFKS